MDRLKYELFYRLWRIWHMRLRDYFDSFTPTEYGTLGRYTLPYAKFVCTSRPKWHMCCNGDMGGWRTSLCDYLEGKWRSTRYYREG